MEDLNKSFDKKFGKFWQDTITEKEIKEFARQREKDLLHEIEKHAKPYLFTKNDTKEVMAVPIYWVEELRKELNEMD